MADDPLLRVFDGGEKENRVGDEVSPADAVEESPEVFEVPDEVVEEVKPSPKKKPIKKKPAKRKPAKKKAAVKPVDEAVEPKPKPKKSKKLLKDGEVLTGSEIIAKCKCTIGDVHAACDAGELVSVYEKCCDSGASQFKFKAV